MWEKKLINQNVDIIESGQLIEKLPVLVSDSENPFSEIPYSIVLSAACDVSSCLKLKNENENPDEFKRQVIFQFMFCPAFQEELFVSGQHLFEIYGHKTLALKSKEVDKFKKDNDRYFFIEQDEINNIPNLFVDYRHYFTLPCDLVFEHIKGLKEKYVLKHIQYTKLSDLFAHYLQRVGIP